MSLSARCAVLLVCFFGPWLSVAASRILVVVPTPTHSHQSVFRPFTQELARRGHQVVVLTTDPAFPPGQAPQNLTEIDLHDVSYKLWTETYGKTVTGKESDYERQIKTAFDVMLRIFQNQMQTEEVTELLADKSQQFDLVVVEAWVDLGLALALFYRAPAILMSTLGIGDELYESIGGPIHPIIYPDIGRTRRYNLSPWEQAKSLFFRVGFHFMLNSLDEKHDLALRDLFGEDVPPLKTMKRNVEAIFANVHPGWEGYRPRPLNVVHLGAMNYAPRKDLPEDFKSLMDSSDRGVIYMSFGSNANPSLLPPERLEVFARVFASLPYDVLWKWKDAPLSFSSNVRTFPWLPQPDLLRHEKLLLFITQGGLQSTDEALVAGVPLLGIPLSGDQWFNVENYERLRVGMYLDLFTLSESTLREAIEKLINNKSYRERSARVGREMRDRPQSALARAVWGAERVMRLRGRRMTTPSSPLTWDEIIQALVLAALVGPVTLIFIAIFLFKIFSYLKLKLVSMCKRGISRAHRYYSRSDHVLPRTS